MTIRFQCSECDSVLKIRDDKAGQAGRCPKCKTAFVIPEPDDEPDDEAEPEAVAGEDAAEEVAPSAELGTADAEDDAMAFLMESGDVPAAAPAANTALDDDAVPGIPPAPVAPEERQLHRPPVRAQVDTDDTSSAAGDLLARGESARAATVDEPPPDPGPRINMDEVKEVAKRRILPIGGGILVVGGLCYLLFSMMANDPDVPLLANVSGTITLDGKPLPNATVNFEPVTDKKVVQQLGGSVGRSDNEGVYNLTYPGGHDGAVLGMHTVRINKTDTQGLEVLAKKYHLQSQMKHEVKAGSNTIDLDLRSEATTAPVNPLANPRSSYREVPN